jgi:transcriptional regulator with XRE-family HTH domain
MPPTPFQAWLDIVRAERGWTLHDLARQLGISATTVFHYKEGAMLPGPGTQQRLAELTATPGVEIARLVRASKLARATRGAAAGRAPLARRRRAKPLGVAFTMYHTRWLPDEYLDRLWAIASARGTSLETALRDALRIALPRMEPRARR